MREKSPKKGMMHILNNEAASKIAPAFCILQHFGWKEPSWLSTMVKGKRTLTRISDLTMWEATWRRMDYTSPGQPKSEVEGFGTTPHRCDVISETLKYVLTLSCQVHRSKLARPCSFGAGKSKSPSKHLMSHYYYYWIQKRVENEKNGWRTTHH